MPCPTSGAATRTPPGLSIVRVNATSGQLAGGGDNVIPEAFLPGTEPGRDRSTVEESTEKRRRRAAGLRP